MEGGVRSFCRSIWFTRLMAWPLACYLLEPYMQRHRPHQSYNRDIRFWVPLLSVTLLRPSWCPTLPRSPLPRTNATSRVFGHHQYGLRIRLSHKYVVLRYGHRLRFHPDFISTHTKIGPLTMGKPAKYVLKPLRTSLLDKLARHKRKLDQLFLNAKEELIRLRSVPNLAPGDIISALR